MIRFIIRRIVKNQTNGLESEEFVTVDANLQELQQILLGGGEAENGYDFRSLIGCEIIKDHKS